MNSAHLNWPPAIPGLLWTRQECPLCSSIEFRSAEPEWLDRVLFLFRLRAVRCVSLLAAILLVCKGNFV